MGQEERKLQRILNENCPLIQELTGYVPYNEQEERDREMILSFLRSGEDIWTRKNPMAHMTVSAWVTNPARDQVLMAHHKIYNSWAWLGGHADGKRDLLAVAVREAMEESGVTAVRPVDQTIFSLEVLAVNGHEKNGKYVSSHLHLNVTYLLEADMDEPLCVRESENTGVAWFPLVDCEKVSDEAWIRERIYRKLAEKMRKR